MNFPTILLYSLDGSHEEMIPLGLFVSRDDAERTLERVVSRLVDTFHAQNDVDTPLDDRPPLEYWSGVQSRLMQRFSHSASETPIFEEGEREAAIAHATETILLWSDGMNGLWESIA